MISKSHTKKYTNRLIQSLFILFLAGMTISSAQAQSKVYNWKLGYTWPDNFPLFTVSVKSVAKYAKELSNGRLNISVEGSTSHKKPLGIFDMVKDGEYEMGQSAGFYWQKKDVNTALLGSLPFGMIAQERYAWFYNGGGNELTQRVYNKHGMKMYPAGNTGMQMSGWYKKEIKTIEDLQGLKMRVPGIGGTVMAAVGVEPFSLQASKLYGALETGELDAVNWAGPGIDLRMKFFEQAKYYYTGWDEPAVELQFLVNEKAYNSLPKDLQIVLDASMKLAAFESFVGFQHGNTTQFKKMLEEHPEIQVRAFPASIIRQFAKETRNELQKILDSSDDPLSKEIINSQIKYQNQARQWTRFGDQAYLNNTYPLLPF